MTGDSTAPEPSEDILARYRGWVEALRSGRYEQGRGRLRKGDSFCCLGVLCDLHGGGSWEEGSHGLSIYRLDEEAEEGMLPKCLRKRLLVSHVDQVTLANMNDEGRSFEEIANYIELTMISPLERAIAEGKA